MNEPPTKPRGRPTGPRRPCGWCGKLLTAVQDRAHFANCPLRPCGNHFDIEGGEQCPRCGKIVLRDQMGREINPPEGKNGPPPRS